MKQCFDVSQQQLVHILGLIQPICNKRTTLDITDSIHFTVSPRELVLKATDLEISLQANIEIENQDVETVSMLVMGKRIFEVVKELEGIISFTIERGLLTITSGSASLSLNIKDAEEFPAFPERIENLLEIDKTLFLKLLQKVSFLIPSNNANSALNGMLWELTPDYMALVATDGHCLSRVITKAYTLPKPQKWLIPKRAVLEIKKILEGSQSERVFLGTCGNQLVFSGNNFNFFTCLLSEPFPRYEGILKKDGFLPAQIAREPFLKTLKRANCLLDGQFISTTFSFLPDKVSVFLHNKEVGKLDESIAIQQFEGSKTESKFYSPYLLNGIQAFAGEQLQFYIKDAMRPIIFEKQDGDAHVTYLVMPVSST